MILLIHLTHLNYDRMRSYCYWGSTNLSREGVKCNIHVEGDVVYQWQSHLVGQQRICEMFHGRRESSKYIRTTGWSVGVGGRHTGLSHQPRISVPRQCQWVLVKIRLLQVMVVKGQNISVQCCRVIRIHSVVVASRICIIQTHVVAAAFHVLIVP